MISYLSCVVVYCILAKVLNQFLSNFLHFRTAAFYEVPSLGRSYKSNWPVHPVDILHNMISMAD